MYISASSYWTNKRFYEILPSTELILTGHLNTWQNEVIVIFDTCKNINAILAKKVERFNKSSRVVIAGNKPLQFSSNHTTSNKALRIQYYNYYNIEIQKDVYIKS